MKLDTRTKILTLAEAAVAASSLHSAGSRITAFVSHLEVLRAPQVQALNVAAAEGGKVIVVLTDPEAPLATLDARAEVAAALRMVDYVVPAPEGAAPVLAAIQPDRVIDDEELDRGRTRDLIAHVRSRSRS